MIKQALRKTYKQLRKSLSLDDIDNLSLEIANQLLTLDLWRYNYYHIFLPIEEQKEVNTEFILNILSGKDKHILISKSDFSTLKMSHYLLTDSTKIKKNKYNIPEPVDGIEIDTKKIEAVFIPLLAFDKLGNRVGYGKGFYDKFLSACEEDTVKIGLSFFEAENRIDHMSDNDVKLDLCVTPKTIYQF